MDRRLTLRYDDGTPVGEAKVRIEGQRDRRFDGYSDGRGQLLFAWDDDWIDRVLVDDVEVKRDWSFSYGDRDLSLSVAASSQNGSSFVADASRAGRTTEHLFLLRDQHGLPLSGRKLVLIAQGGQRYDATTDASGQARVRLAEQYLERVELDDAVVQRDLSLTGLWGPKTEIEIEVQGASALDAAGGQERRLRLRYHDGAPVAGKEVSLYDQYDRALRLVSDHDGVVRFSWREDVIARVDVEQLPVKRDWSIAGFLGPQSELELEVPRPTGARLEERAELRHADSNYRQAGVRGRLFYHDGTQVREPFKVTVTLRGGKTYDSEQPRCYCQDNGEFFIATDEYAKSEGVTRLWVRHDELDQSRWLRDAASGYYVVLIPKGFGRGSGDQGGVIAGEVVNRDGSPHPNSRIKAGVRASGFFGGGGEVETYADDKGRFILIFEGGVSLKYLYVDNSEPLAVFNGRHQGAQRLDAHRIQAGSFGIVLVRQGGLFS